MAQTAQEAWANLFTPKAPPPIEAWFIEFWQQEPDLRRLPDGRVIAFGSMTTEEGG